MSITDERKKTIDFTNKYYSNYLAIIGEKGKVAGTNDLAGKVVGPSAPHWPRNGLKTISWVRQM